MNKTLSIMLKTIIWILLIVLVVFGITFLIVCIWRAGLPYNEIGRYFNLEYMVVYDSGAALVYGLLSLISFSLAFVINIVRRKLFCKPPSLAKSD